MTPSVWPVLGDSDAQTVRPGLGAADEVAGAEASGHRQAAVNVEPLGRGNILDSQQLHNQ